MWVWPAPSCVPQSPILLKSLLAEKQGKRAKPQEAVFSVGEHALAHTGLDRAWEASTAKEGWIPAGVAWDSQEPAGGKLVGNAWGKLESLFLRH